MFVFISLISVYRLGFELDGVVLEPSNITRLLYYPDPELYNFSDVQNYSQILIIKVELSNGISCVDY